ncbi:hypothetical protein ACXR2U_12270 [Jatrophihabitans sp. YIM 134969]
MATAARRVRQVAAAALVAVVVVWTCTSGPVLPDLSHRPGLALGLAGPFTEASLYAAHEAGVVDLIVEMTWREAEPEPGRFDDAYLAHVGRQVTELRTAGFRVTLNTGLQDAPTWVLDLPGGRFVDQHGEVYTRTTTPNLVFSPDVRGSAEAYLAHVLGGAGGLGRQVDLVRAGGGVLGELSYPYTFGPDGLVQNRYWAYDDHARAADPVGAWRPGDPSPHGEAQRFLSWYLDALVDFQDWQVDALRAAGYRGPVAMLYPSHGMRPGDFDRAVATDLRGTSSAEVNGEVQRGYDFARQVAALRDPGVIVYGTWAENLDTVGYLADLARRSGRQVMAENAGPMSPEELTVALRNAAVHRLSAFFLIRASDLADASHGRADFADVGRAYRSVAPDS